MGRLYPEVWLELLNRADCPPNLLGEIYVVLANHLAEPPPRFVRDEQGIVRDLTVGIEARAALANSDPQEAERLLGELLPGDFDSEAATVAALTSVHESLVDIGGDDFGRAHLAGLQAFVGQYNLRYYLDDTARLWLTFPGVAAVVFEELRATAATHPHLSQELTAFEHALAECLQDPTEHRIKIAIQKQFNLTEAFGGQHPAVSGNTLGRMLEEVGTWPHACLPDVGKGLYKFACDYPGIRHAGNYDAALHPLDLRDLMGVSLALVGLTPYLSDGFEEVLAAALLGDSADIPEIASRAPWLPLAEPAAGVG